MHKIQVGDRQFTLFIDSATIAEHVKKIALEIDNEYRALSPVFVCVLNGAFIFAADVVRHMQGAVQLSFVKISSYAGTQSTGNTQQLIGLNEDIAGRHVVVLEDIVDTGKTITDLVTILAAKNPASVKIATFLSKPSARVHQVDVHFTCFEIPDSFVVGYGLDYNGYGRALPSLYQLAE